MIVVRGDKLVCTECGREYDEEYLDECPADDCPSHEFVDGYEEYEDDNYELEDAGDQYDIEYDR